MKIKLLLSLLIVSFYSFSQSFQDDFESYTVGNYLALSSNNWTTWSSNPGSAEDVIIVNTNSHSASNSIYFSSTSGGPQDVVLPFGGQYSSGNFIFETWMLVETGMNAYFNFQADSIIGNTWAMDANFSAGSVVLDDGGTNSLSGIYPINTWFNIVIDVDLDLGVWELLIDGVSQGTFSNTNSVASLDLYPIQGSGFFIDDLSYSYTLNQSSWQQLGNLDLVSMHNSDLSDIWGWVDSLGNEYAIVGVNNGTSVVDVTNPANPVEVFFEPGMNSIWRDIKTYNGYAYVTTEAQNGLLIIDLNTLPSNPNLSTYYYTDTSSNGWLSSHNLYIDENGYCYIFGANRGNGGCIIFDLNSNPTNPTEIGEIDNWYVHDGMARGDTLYLANVMDGFISIWDISNISSPQLLAQQVTPGAFSHNLWISDDGDYIYTTDEITNGYIGEYDISNLGNITELDRIQSSAGQNVIPHNSHFINDYLVTSYYRDGVVIHDVSNKGNMVEIGSFDTSPNYTGDGFNGCWGAYPWLPSGNIIVSDMEEGLYVIGSNYQRACYLEGNITDLNTGSAINTAQIEIMNTTISDNSSLTGDYATGIANSGTYDIIYSHPQYFSDTIFGLSLTNGNITVQDVQLIPIQGFSYTVLVQNTGLTGIDSVIVNIENINFTYNGTTDNNGIITFHNFYPGTYVINAGKWGLIEFCDTSELIDGSILSYVIDLDSGYADLFNLDLGWTVSGAAPDGVWERGNPNGTTYSGAFSNPEDDAQDCGNSAYVTGNAGGQVGADDVDQAETILLSPYIDLGNNMSDFGFELDVWWFNSGGQNNPNDSLLIYIIDDVQEELIFEYTEANSGMQWLTVFGHIPLNLDRHNLRLKVYTADWQSFGGNLVEAGIDNFKVFTILNSNLSQDIKFNIYPNPSNGDFIIDTDFNYNTIEIIDMYGKKVDEIKFAKEFSIKNKGIYFVVLEGISSTIIKKVVVF